MKKSYEIPELKITLLQRSDVIVTSDAGGGGGQDPEFPDFPD